MSNAWLPIESAPRDGTLILAANSRMRDMTVVGWTWTHWTDVGLKNQGSCISVNPNYFDYWMPLPNPPSHRHGI